MDRTNLLFELSNIIDKTISNTFELHQDIFLQRRKELDNSPYIIDLLNDVLKDKNLKEISHTLILYRLLKYNIIFESFIHNFLPIKVEKTTNIEICSPDKNRIDLFIKSNEFCLIIESKINGANEQPHQIDKYVNIAKKSHARKKICVLYLGGEHEEKPSENSLSDSTCEYLGNRLVCINYKEHITPWIESIYKIIDFQKQPYVKSALLSYKTYLKNKYNLNPMNNKIDNTIITKLKLDQLNLSEKISTLEDQIENIDLVKKRMEALRNSYYMESHKKDISTFYANCNKEIESDILLNQKNEIEFGFDFKYSNVDFRCCVSYDTNSAKPYWGIKGIKERADTCEEIFNEVRNKVLQSNLGLFNNVGNSVEWAISNNEEKNLIESQFINLAKFIVATEDFYISKKEPVEQ